MEKVYTENVTDEDVVFYIRCPFLFQKTVYTAQKKVRRLV